MREKGTGPHEVGRASVLRSAEHTKHGPRRDQRDGCHEGQRAPTASTFRRYDSISDKDLRVVAKRIGMSTGMTDHGATRARLVTVRSS